MRLLAVVGIAVCWGAFALVWLTGALYNATRAPSNGSRAPFVPLVLAAAIIAAGVAKVLPTTAWDSLTVQSAWVRLVGLAILVPSTVFTLWARVALGTMWSSAPMVKQRHELRTDGPYGVTRHPIYTGMLGMILGTALLVGVGQWAVLFPIVLVFLEIKLHIEEGLMAAAFPDDYPDYRRQVPQLVPRLRRRRRPQ